MRTIDFIAALAIAATLTIAFCSLVDSRTFRWRDASISALLLVLVCWTAAVAILAFGPVLAKGRVAVMDLVTSVCAFVVLAMILSQRVRRSLGAVFRSDCIVTRYAVLIYFTITLLLLLSAVVTRYSVLYLF